MANTKRDFEESEDVREVAMRIYDAYDYMLEGLNLNDVYFALCSGKKSATAANVIRKGVPDPLAQKVSKSRYQIAFYTSDWSEWTDAQKHAMMFEVLYSIDIDGKYKKQDVKGYYPIIKTLGPDWMDDPELVDIIDKKIVFKTRLPKSEDEGTSTGAKAQKKDPILADIIAEAEAKEKALAKKAAKEEDAEEVKF